MYKETISGKNARILLENGVNKVANIVKTTLGPKGRNAVLERGFLQPLITNDGVTIAKEIDLEDKFENLGAKLIKEVCQTTNDCAGDGTTTAIVLAQKLLNESMKTLSTKNINPLWLISGIRKATDNCIETLKQNSKPVLTSKEIEQVATISSGDNEIGKLIAEAKSKVGSDGTITLQDGNTDKTFLTVHEGMQFDKGYVSPYMCNDISKMQVLYNDALLLVTDMKISNIQELLPILEQIVATNQNLVIICDDIEDEVLSALVINKMRGTFNCTVVKAPMFGDKKTAILEDIAVLCNTTMFSKTKGSVLKDIQLENLGKLKQVKITKDNTTIVPSLTNKDLLLKRMSAIKEQIELAETDFDKDQLKTRLSKLAGGVATIYVGATTEVEQKEKKLRIEDAINATNAATEMGIVAGGGIALLNCKKRLIKFSKTLNSEEKQGANIVLKTISEPLKQILNNAEIDFEETVSKIENKNNINFGYDAKNNRFCDMIKSGIIDPAKVTISALKNATSIVTTMLTTDTLVVEKEKSLNS